MSLGHFDKGYFKFLKVIESNGGTPCEDMPENFFPEDMHEPILRAMMVENALAVCASCPIKEECLKYAIESNQKFGIWGGTLASER